MKSSWNRKYFRKIAGFFILATGLWYLFNIFLIGLVLTSIGVYLAFGLDMHRSFKASKTISDKFKDNGSKDDIQFIYDSFLPGIGSGHLAITERRLIFLSRIGNIEISTQLKDIQDYGYNHVDVGIYQTAARDIGTMRIGSTPEGTIPVFHFEGKTQKGQFGYIIETPKFKKFYKVLEHSLEHGILSKETKQREPETEKTA